MERALQQPLEKEGLPHRKGETLKHKRVSQKLGADCRVGLSPSPQ